MSQKAAIVPSWHVFQLCLNTEPLTVTSYTCSFHIQLFVGEYFFYDIFLRLSFQEGFTHPNRGRGSCSCVIIRRPVHCSQSASQHYFHHTEKKNPKSTILSQNIPARKCFFFFFKQSIISRLHTLKLRLSYLQLSLK